MTKYGACTYFKLLLLFLITILARPALGQFSEEQQAKIDSLTTIINEDHHDTVLAEAYYQLSDILYVVELDTILYLCNKAVDIGEANLKNNISESERLCFLRIKADCYNNIGYVYKSHGDIPAALEYYNDALILNEELENVMGRANLHNNIAVIYEGQGDVAQAVEYYEKGLELFKSIDYKKGVATTLNNMGRIYRGRENNNEKALAYYEESLEIRKEIDDKYGIANSLNNIGYVHLRLQDTTKALAYYEESLMIRQQLQYKLGVVSSLINIGGLQLSRGNSEVAHDYGTKALTMGQAAGLTEYVRDAAGLLRDVHRAQGETEKELEMFTLYVEMRDSIDSQENKTAVYKQQLQYEYQKKKALDQKETEKQLAISDEKKERQKIVTIIVSVFLFVFTLLSIFLFNRWRLTQKQKKIIESQNETLAKKNKEKEYMMMEMHHRVKNNLQIVNSLLRFQSKDISDPEVVQMFEDSQKRILSMSLVHEQMYRSVSLMEIDSDVHLSRLVAELIKDYNIDKEISLNCEIEKNSIGVKTLIPLGLIVNEVVSNSLKHAFEGREKGVISIALRKISDWKFELIVGDDGIGSQKADDPEKAASLGMELIQVFTDQLEGVIETLDGPGTNYKIVFYDQQ